jgi:hypothetical protein
MFYCVIFTVVWRVISKAYFKATLIREFYHSLQELSSATTAFRAIVHVDDKSSHSTEILFAGIPPERDTIGDKITGFVAFGEKQKCFTAGGFQDASRHKLLFGHHFVIERLDRPCAARLAATRIIADMNGRFCIKAYPNSVWLRIRVCIY